MRRFIVKALEDTCGVLDDRFPKVYWCRWFATWSFQLDERWQTGHWTDGNMRWDDSGRLSREES